MEEKCEELTIDPVIAEFRPESCGDSVRPPIKNERTKKAYLKVRDLEASIRESELQLKAARAETLDLLSEHREELQSQLSLELPKSGFLVENTKKFLQLFADQEFDEKPRIPTYESGDTSPTGHEKDRSLVSSTESENSDRKDPIPSMNAESNPYAISESSRELLNEIEKKLTQNSNNEVKII